MTIKSFQGSTKEEAVQQAKVELGESVVITNVKKIRPKGFLGMFKKSFYEVTAAVEEEVLPRQPFSAFTSGISDNKNNIPRNRFDAKADEPIVIPPMENKIQPVEETPKEILQEESLRDAFRAVSEIMSQVPDESFQKPVESQKNKIQEAKKEINKQDYFAETSILKQDTKTEFSMDQEEKSSHNSEFKSFVKILYNELLEHEVNEIYINQIMEDLDKASRSSNSIDYLISSIYQKMILKLGQPNVIEVKENTPKVVFFIGPTGVGKTTTIAKIASKFKLEQKKKVALLTADTYRIAAAEQLRTYANILDTPLSIVYSPEELNAGIDKYQDYDLILVDTAGFSHKNQEQKADMKALLERINPEYEKEVYLVLSATTKYKDLKDIVDIYRNFTKFSVIFTKLDETTSFGNLYNIRLYANAPLSYITTGQNVPDDIEILDTQKMVKQLLGGK